MECRVENNSEKIINPKMFGLFLEDINYGVDGGLYAELIENRSFEFSKTVRIWNGYLRKYDGLYAWKPYPNMENDKISLSIEEEKPAYSNTPHYLICQTNSNYCGFTNQAYDGIYMQAGMEYTISFYYRTKSYSGAVIIQITEQDTVVAEEAVVLSTSSDWTKVEIKLEAEKKITKGQFIVLLENPGTIAFDHFSMMPSDTVCGLFRKDLAERLKSFSPGFLRFPGGCVVEGNTLDSRYQWKRTLGKWENRIPNWNRWATHVDTESGQESTPYTHYNQTLGIGFYEYFLLCEYLGAVAVPILSAGIACQFMSTEKVSTESKEFLEYIQDALDLVEFANGPKESQWGKVRCDMGHPEPFHLKMIGIGNEQWETKDINYFERYKMFYEAIHKEYPDILLIGSAGPNVDTDTFYAAWNYYRSEQSKYPGFVYAVDEHYYMKPSWFRNNVHFYDDYPRDIKVFAGEYAAHIGNGMNRPELNTWKSALAEAEYMVGMVKNGDVVTMASYAPLLARVGYTQWSPNLIWFDGENSYETPNFLVQKLFSHHIGDVLVKTSEGRLPYVVTKNQNTNEMYLILVNPNPEVENISFTPPQPFQMDGKASIITADYDDFNTISQPEKVRIIETELSDSSIVVQPYSIIAITYHI